ncbi:Protein of unknown function [Methylobacterium sp. UNC378MF]|jgi:ABC-type uncharacterized transport system fused permease/ATPase subunit|uniref:DUF1656 domain-containing protein n=1 Tax=unclassified Methylobacterium TaxID=2615210 RepID=UPI00088A9411|nr:MULTISPECIES: DUF1656 domain-containing protein [unclassified Methylobacterium]KAA0124853.1 DUF1656 domain-containing protein [Methylobacterium sp. P1-11]SDA15016.1 Protein of unknown function [Methylobacterium sp. UNC378MF]
MHEDIHVGGVLVSAFVAYALAAFVILVVLRRVFARIRFSRYVANAPLAEAGLYVCVLALLIAFI